MKLLRFRKVQIGGASSSRDLHTLCLLLIFPLFLYFSVFPYSFSLCKFFQSLFFARPSSLFLVLRRLTLLTSAKLNTSPRKSWRRLSRIFRSILDAWSRSISNGAGAYRVGKTREAGKRGEGGGGGRRAEKTRSINGSIKQGENSTGRRKFVRGID